MLVNSKIYAGVEAGLKAANTSYIISEVRIINHDPPLLKNNRRSFAVFLKDPITEVIVPLVWTDQDELKEGSELISLCRNLLQNGLNCVTDLIEERHNK